MVAAAVIGSAVVGGIASSSATKSAAKTASAAQTQATEASVEEQRRQFDEMKALLEPYVTAGSPALAQMAGYADIGPKALEAQANLAGLNGPEAQQAAIQNIEQSELYQAQVRQGEEALLQNAAATGGLRGGNLQGALAQYRPQMLSQEIQNTYDRLGGFANFGAGMTQNLAKLGQASAAGQAAQGMEMASNIGNLNMAAGDARAQAALMSGQANANMWGNVAGSVGQLGVLGMMGYGPFA